MTESLPVRATSIAGISKMFGLGKSTLRRAIRSGKLRATRIGRRVVIRVADAEAFVASDQTFAHESPSSARGVARLLQRDPRKIDRDAVIDECIGRVARGRTAVNLGHDPNVARALEWLVHDLGQLKDPK